MSFEAQDHASIDQARPEERRQVNSSPFQFNGAGLPGSPEHEPYNIGQDYRGLEIEDMRIPVGSDMGDLSQPSQPQGDNMLGLDVEPFVDVIPLYDPSGHDAMDGVVTDQHVEILAQEQMYGVQSTEQFRPIPETANPLYPYNVAHPSRESSELDE